MQHSIHFGFRHVNVEAVNVDGEYQRVTSPRMVSKIVKEFDLDSFGTLCVGERSDSTLWCVDGQTRLEAAKQMEFETVPAMVFASKGKAHEAKVYQAINDHRSVNRAQKFFAQLCAGDERAHAINELVETCGFNLSFDNRGGWGYLRAIAAVEDAYDLGSLQRTLETIQVVWGPDRNAAATHQTLLSGMARFYARHGEIVDDRTFRPKLMAYMPEKLFGMATGVIPSASGMKHAMYLVLVRIHNQGKRKNRIPAE